MRKLRQVVAARCSSPSGSSRLIARNAVGAVNSAAHLVLRDHPPERAGVGRADRLALVEDRRAAVQQRRVDDVGVADHPADVGGRPEHLARLDAVDVLHRPVERDGVAAVVAHDALGLAGRARGVEDVERIGRRDRHAVGRLRPPPSPRPSRGRGPASSSASRLRPLQDDAALGLVLGQVDRARRAAACRRRRGRARCRRRPTTIDLRLARRRCALASSCAAKPPNTTEWIAPSRAQASIAITASGTIGM